MKNDRYKPMTYSGLVNRIRNNVPLTEHQKKTMAQCGLTVDDFKNQKTTAERVTIINANRMFKRMKESQP